MLFWLFAAPIIVYFALFFWGLAKYYFNTSPSERHLLWDRYDTIYWGLVLGPWVFSC